MTKQCAEFNLPCYQLGARQGEPKPVARLWEDVIVGIKQKKAKKHIKNKSVPTNDTASCHQYFFQCDDRRISFTRREALTMAYFLQGKTMRQAACLQAISPRTVENYSNNLRKKLCCKTKKELIKKVKASEFHELFLSGEIFK